METYLSRIEAILNGEDIKPLSRVEELLKDYGGDGYDETYNTDEDKIKNDAFMLIYEGGSILYDDTDSDPLVIGSREGQNFYNMTITGVRVYAN